LSPRTRVLLVDDHTIVRQGFRLILESDETVEIVGEASSGTSAVEMAARLLPDVIVMDIALPDLNGIEATRRILEHDKRVKVLILTMLFDDESVRLSLAAGARGYLLKDSEDLDVVKAVHALGNGGSFFSPRVSKVLVAGYLGGGGQRTGGDELALLSDRERDVLQQIALGKTNREIAADLKLSAATVAMYRRQIMEKLELRNTAEIVRFAMRKEVVE
jgi:two-component system, NarL family, response regulator NreC